MADFERIIKYVRRGDVTLFIGAGFSIEAQAPSVRDLCNAILSQIDNTELRNTHEGDSLADLSEYFVEEVCCGSRNSLIEVLHEKFDFKPAVMYDHKMMAQIPHFKNIITTNYDTLLEDSYTNKDINVVKNDKDCAYINDQKPVTIYKVHGDFSDPDTVVITTQDYKNLFKNPRHPQMWKLISSLFIKTHVLFIGYSLEDRNVLKMIRQITKSINLNQKDMFLIAPKIPDTKKEQLRKMHVQYFEAYASEFLEALTVSLKKNISADFRHKEIDSQTYSRFCQLHNFSPVTEYRQDSDNRIVGINQVDDHPIKHSLNFSVNKEGRELFETLDFEKDGENPTDSKFPIKGVPVIRFNKSCLLNAQHTINDVVINDEIAEVLIAPRVYKRKLTISIEKRNFLETIEADFFRLNDHTTRMIADCNIFKLIITFKAADVNKEAHIWATDFSFQMNDKYTDNNLALKWIELPCAFFGGEDVAIPELASEPLNCTNSTKPFKADDFNSFQHYYRLIKDIELKTKQKFEVYNNYTEDRFNSALIILCYLLHKPVNIPANSYFRFKAMALGEVEYNNFNKGEKLSIILTEDNHQLSLNGREFKIPFAHIILNECDIENVSLNKEGQLIIELCYKQPIFQKLFSDKEVLEEFNHLHSNSLKLIKQ